MFRYPGLFIVSSLVFLSVIDMPHPGARENNPLLGELHKHMGNGSLRRSASLAGKERALICSYCHGVDGNSLKPEVPNLAGQNPEYLLEQIGRFAREERKDYVMNSLASQFTEQDQINLAIYYAGQKVKPGDYNYASAVRGKKLYLQVCQGCHGKQGLGNPGYARLAGQKPAYLRKTLARFRDVALNRTSQKKRRSPIMEPIASRLSDQDIQYLAAYLTSLP